MMDERLSDELISAYLDGELSSDEQTQVEELLMDSVEHRKMFNELRTLRESLQSLPSYTLGDDFADRVLQQAERTMLSKDSTPTGAAVLDDTPTAKPAAPKKVQLADKSPTERGIARGIGWSIAAIAAAVAIAMFFGPSGSDETTRVAGGPDSDELKRVEEENVEETQEGGKAERDGKEQDDAKTKQEVGETPAADPAPHDPHKSQEDKSAGVFSGPDVNTEVDKGGGSRTISANATPATDKRGMRLASGGAAGGEGGGVEPQVASFALDAVRAAAPSDETFYIHLNVSVEEHEKQEVDSVLLEAGLKEFVPQTPQQKQVARQMALNVAAADRFLQAKKVRKRVADEEDRNKDVEADDDIVIVETTLEGAEMMLKGLRERYGGFELASVPTAVGHGNEARDLPEAPAFAYAEEKFADRAHNERESDDALPGPASVSKTGEQLTRGRPDSERSSADFRGEPGGFGGAAKGVAQRGSDDGEGGKPAAGGELKKAMAKADQIDLADTLEEPLPSQSFYRVPSPSVASKWIKESSPINQRGYGRLATAPVEDAKADASGGGRLAAPDPSDAPEGTDGAGAGGGAPPVRRAKNATSRVTLVLLIQADKSQALAADPATADADAAGDSATEKRAPADPGKKK